MAYRHISFLYTLAKLNAFFLGQSENVSAERTSNSITKQVNSHLRFIYRKSNCLSYETRRTLIRELIHCHFYYSCSTWFLSENIIVLSSFIPIHLLIFFHVVANQWLSCPTSSWFLHIPVYAWNISKIALSCHLILLNS
jgi:hypothetical protein